MMAKHNGLQGLKREELSEGDIIERTGQSNGELVLYVGETWTETLMRYVNKGKKHVVNTYYFYNYNRGFDSRGNVLIPEDGVSYPRLDNQLTEAGL